jgi:peptidoglycan/LPS O-acetylase OafA/YrhL
VKSLKSANFGGVRFVQVQAVLVVTIIVRNGDEKSTAPGSAPVADSVSSRVAELDGFRAFAVLMVFVHHLFYGWPTAALSSTPRLIRAVLGRGWLGVDLFFVLSGFLITGILIDSREGEHYFRNFYTRRILRIVPLYLTCILIMYFGYPDAGAYFRLSLLYLANFSYFFGVKVPHGPGVFWSLAIEEHFYLIWPLVVRFLNRFWLLGLTALIVFGTPILRGICAHAGMNPELEIYPYSFFRFDGLALGAMLALWVRSRYYSRSSAWALAGFLIGSSCLILLVGLPYGITGAKTVAGTAFHYTQAEFVFAGLMALALAYRGSTFTAFLRCRALGITADLSYCIYLIHLTVGDFYYRLLHAMHFDDVVHLGAVGALGLRILVVGTATFGLAALSKKFLENPFLRLKRYF